MCNLSEAIETRGIETGIKEGEAKSRKEIALKLLAMLITADQISQATGLTLEEINQLKN